MRLRHLNFFVLATLLFTVEGRELRGQTLPRNMGQSDSASSVSKRATQKGDTTLLLAHVIPSGGVIRRRSVSRTQTSATYFGLWGVPTG
jgi:hypothetical protein